MSCLAALTLGVAPAAENDPKALAPLDSPTDLFNTRPTNATPLVEGQNDANVVKLVAQILRRQHYLRLPIDDETSSKFLDRYLDSLDNLHLYFFQSDLAEFEKFRYKLDDLTVDDGDATPARAIFTRFRQRLDQQYEYVLDLLKSKPQEAAPPARPRPSQATLARPPPLRISPGEVKQGEGRRHRQEPGSPLHARSPDDQRVR
ncbi:MAG: hypothetical protein DME25_22250 [Verrucomicrobia bacterium]|nr:MAG: hypothetical protein DME25_22250 [Verrucomicrobiota bacterium]